MDKINWKAKLTSRKLWLAVAGLVTGVITLLRPGTDTTQISGVILALGSVIAYIVGEGLVDAASAGAPTLPADELIAAEGKTDDPAASTPQTGAEDAHAAFPGLDNITLDQANAAVEAANIALGNATSDEDKAQLNLYLEALKTLQAAKAAESGADAQ